MLGQFEATFAGNGPLASFDFRVVELFHPAALHAEQMIVVVAPVELVDRLVIVEMVPDEDAGLFELGQYPVDRSQADIDMFAQQHAIDVIGREVTAVGRLEQTEDFETGAGDLEAAVPELFSACHRL